MTARWARTARGWSVALLAGVLTAALHASAGGGFPAPMVLLLAVLLSGLVSTALVGRTPSLPRLAGTVAAGQLTFHTVFTVFGNGGVLASPGVVPAAGGHAGHTAHALAVQTAAPHTVSAHTGPEMLLAHLLAGLLCALLLSYSERAMHGIKRLAAVTLQLLTRLPTLRPLPLARTGGIAAAMVLPRTATILQTLRYRGPPALLRAA